MLGARQAELTAAMDLHERKAAYHSQQLRKLRSEKRALAEEQQSVSDAIDPEATAAARLAAAQARAAEEEAELQSRRQFAVRGLRCGLLVCACKGLAAAAASATAAAAAAAPPVAVQCLAYLAARLPACPPQAAASLASAWHLSPT